MKKLLITDLDDTLYCWLDFFVPSFYAMLKIVSEITDIDQPILINEYKQLHQKYRTVEYPFLTLKLPSIKNKFPKKTDAELKVILGEAFHIFNSERKKRLSLFPEVENTLKYLYDEKIIIVGYTESTLESGYYRLRKLGISDYFKHVFLSESPYSNNNEYRKLVSYVKNKKPNSQVLLDICNIMECQPSETIYVGDSLTKDIYMAINANITSVWANYPKTQSSNYQKLVDITSWTNEDFIKECELKKIWKENNLKPDHEIHIFSELIEIIKTYNQ